MDLRIYIYIYIFEEQKERRIVGKNLRYVILDFFLALWG